MNSHQLQRGTFLLLLAAVTLGFLWLLLPFFGAVMWAVALAIIFTPTFKRLSRRLGQRRTLAALITLAVSLIVVILPLAIIGASLVRDISLIAAKIRGGQLDYALYFERIVASSPRWLIDSLSRFGLTDFSSVQERVSAAALQGSQLLATQALSIGQNTFDFLVSFFVMLYLLFFLLRDGSALSKIVRDSLPFAHVQTTYLLKKFTTVTRATIKGNIAVALVQGILGGVAFWTLGVQGPLVWGVLMGFLSLLPAVGAALVWLPAAIYLLAIGAVGKGIGLIAFGVLAIGMVDNVLRPILVGKETKMPDYIVLMSTIGGIAVFGINGFVIGPVIAALFLSTWSLFNEVTHDDSIISKATDVENALKLDSTFHGQSSSIDHKLKPLIQHALNKSDAAKQP